MIPEALDEACREFGHPCRLRAAVGDQPDSDADGRGAPRGRLPRSRASTTSPSSRAMCSVRWSRTGPPPIAAMAPERTLYFTSFTKITVPGLRIGYLVAPDRYVAAVANRHLVSNWMATPIIAEIAIEMGGGRHGDGTRALAAHGAARAPGDRGGRCLADVRYPDASATRCICGCRCRTNRTEEGFVAQARLQGVAIAPGASFRTSDAPWQPAVRISLGSTTEGELRAGLAVVVQAAARRSGASVARDLRLAHQNRQSE